LPPLSTATSAAVVLKITAVAAPENVHALAVPAPLPATWLIEPPLTLRTHRRVVSMTYRFPAASTSMWRGALNETVVGAPENVHAVVAPLPANKLMLPAVTLRMQLFPVSEM
jgi:hypothetical protein